MIAERLLREARAELALGWAVRGGETTWSHGVGRPDNTERLLVQYGNKNLTFEDLEAVTL